MAAVYKSLSKSSDLNKDKREETASNGVKKNKQKVLILSSRGVTYRHRHLLNDLYALFPHARKETKLDTKTKLYQLNELAELYNANNVFFLEARKKMDAYLWLSKAPNGPTVKLHVQNIHTMEELNFVGNSLRGSRPILSFDENFDKEPHLQLLKEIFLHVFGVPKTSRKIKPFIDHVCSFTLADGKVWFRNYQITETEPSKPKPNEEEDGSKPKTKGKGTETELSLVEIGPRFCLTPIVILEGSFGGPKIYENKEFVSPNQVRAEIRMKKAGRYNERAEQDIERQARKDELGLRTDGFQKPKDALDTSELFA